MAIKPLYATIAALAVAAAAAAFIVPNIGNPPVVPASLMAQLASSTAASSAATAAPNGSIRLSFAVGGRVGAVLVSQGATVKKGQLLASLDVAAASTAIDQAKASLDLAQAQFSSAQLQYETARIQQDTLVANALHTLLSTGLTAVPMTGSVDETHDPVVTGTYGCDKTGAYEIRTYISGTASNYSFTVTGLESGSGPVTYGTPQPLGTCGLYITFQQGFSGATVWDVAIPNIQSATYQADKNAYDLAVATRAQTLSQLGAAIGVDPNAPDAATASAAVSVARAAYAAAEARYADDLIVAPSDGTIAFIDPNLKVGSSVAAGQSVMTMTAAAAQ